MFTRQAIAFAVVMCLGGVAVAALSLGERPRRVKFSVGPDTHLVEPAELAGWIIEGRRDCSACLGA